MAKSILGNRSKRVWNKHIDYWFTKYTCPKCNEETKQLMKIEEYPGLTGMQCDWCGEMFMLEYPEDVVVEPKVYKLKTQVPVK